MAIDAPRFIRKYRSYSGERRERVIDLLLRQRTDNRLSRVFSGNGARADQENGRESEESHAPTIGARDEQVNGRWYLVPAANPQSSFR